MCDIGEATAEPVQLMRFPRPKRSGAERTLRAPDHDARLGSIYNARPRLVRCLAPQLLQPFISSATAAIVFVSQRIRFVKILVVIFGRIKRAGACYLCQDGTFERLITFERRFRCLGKSLLIVVQIKDPAPVLRASVA